LKNFFCRRRKISKTLNTCGKQPSCGGHQRETETIWFGKSISFVFHFCVILLCINFSLFWLVGTYGQESFKKKCRLQIMKNASVRKSNQTWWNFRLVLNYSFQLQPGKHFLFSVCGIVMVMSNFCEIRNVCFHLSVVVRKMPLST
jgi:hypothetical protein